MIAVDDRRPFHRLLAFAGRERREPVALDLNALIEGLQRLLDRMLGSNIELVLRLATPFAALRADPSQMEQVMLNLTANARDAMPDGGELRIETANVEADSAEGCPTECPGGCAPGRCVMLAVSDSGAGMNHETRGLVFDPFFSAKQPERGAGLGLSVVDEVVAEAGGTPTWRARRARARPSGCSCPPTW